MPDAYERLLNKIERKEAVVGIIGLGYVGLPLLIRFCEEGFRVIGFDRDVRKVRALNRGSSYIKHIPGDSVKRLSAKRPPAFIATTETGRLKEADAVIICVPTPLSDKREPDMSYIEAAGADIARRLRPGQLISLESTTYPGTTEEVLLPLFRARGLAAGKDFFLVFSPEREDPGRKDFTTKNTPKVVGGVTGRCLKAGEALYSHIIERVVPVSSTRAAEMTKLLENIYRSVNIALVNELKMLCDRMSIDVWEVIEAARTKPFGFEAFYPGPGLGGHCIPVDPFYLTWKAREYKFSTRFIELAGEINTGMPYFVANKTTEALNSRGKSLKGSKILILGIAYKKNVDDLRESPSLEIIHILGSKGARVDYNDPFVPRAHMEKSGRWMRSVKLTKAALKKYDCVLIATNHSSYDYKWIVGNSRLVIDTRNAAKGLDKGKVVKA